MLIQDPRVDTGLVKPEIVECTEEDFINPWLQYDTKRKLFKLLVDYSFEWGKPNARKKLYMASGFEYDKASVPKFAWGVFRPDGPWEAAALWHDRLYRDEFEFKHPELFRYETFNALTCKWEPDLSKWKRKDADALLAFVGRLGGASKLDSIIYQTAVAIYPPNWFKG